MKVVTTEANQELKNDNPVPIQEIPSPFIEPSSINPKDQMPLRSPATLIVGTPSTIQSGEKRNSIGGSEKEFKLETVSFFKSLFNFSILALGSSTLSLPTKIHNISIIMYPIACLIGGIVNLWSFLILARLYKKFKVRSYEELIGKVYGKKMIIAYAIMMNIYIVGLMLIYQVIIYKLIGGVINLVGEHKYATANDFLEDSYWKGYGYKFGINFGLSILIFFPACILKNISLFTYTSMFGILTLFLLELIIITQSPWYIKDYYKNIYVKDDKSTHYNVYDVKKGFKSDVKFLRILATLFFCFTSHNGIFIVMDSLENNTLPRIKKLIKTSTFIDIGCYILFGIIGYLSEPINDKLELIIERRVLWGKDIVMMIGWIFLILMAITKVPNNFFSFRFSILNLMEIKLEQLSNKYNILLAIITLAVTTLFCSTYQKITDYMDLLGSFCVVIVAFLLPALLEVKTNELPRYHWKNILNMTIGIAFTIFGFASGVLTIIDMTK